jgi:hypothetical protein
MRLDRRTAVVALSHVAQIDDEALSSALKSDCFYVGALGSRRSHLRAAAIGSRLLMGGSGFSTTASMTFPRRYDPGQCAPVSTHAWISSPNLPLRARRRRAALVGMPAPADERILGHVVDELGHRLAAVALRVLDLLADFAQRLADPGHLDWRHVPLRVARDVPGIEVGRPVAGRAAHADGAEVVVAAHDERPMRMAVVALHGAVAGGVAVDAARVLDDLPGLGKKRDRALLVICDFGKSGGWLYLGSSLGSTYQIR